MIPKQVVESYVQQEASAIVIDSDTHGIVPCEPTPPPDIERIVTTEEEEEEDGEDMDDEEEVIVGRGGTMESFISYPSFQSQDNQAMINNPTSSSILSSSMSSDLPVTIQDFQLIKVIGRGCMGKVCL